MAAAPLAQAMVLPLAYLYALPAGFGRRVIAIWLGIQILTCICLFIAFDLRQARDHSFQLGQSVFVVAGIPGTAIAARVLNRFSG
jgi:hypothetical protein